MSVHRRSLRSLAVIGLAVPFIAAVYLGVIARRVISLPRDLLVGLLGAAVIGSVYADEAYRRAPAGVRHGLDTLATPRVTPLRAAGVLTLALALLMTSAPATPVSAAKPAEAVVQAARGYLGTPYRWGATGPEKFDCSGFIFRIFKDVGELPRVGGKRLRAVGYLRWFSSRGLASKTDGQRGDLVVWGKGKHIGIYLGKGKVISALDSGISVHGIHQISLKFTTFLKVQWNVGDGTGGAAPAETGKAKGDKGDKGNRDAATDTAGAEETAAVEPTAAAEQIEEALDGQPKLNGLATGTMNLRKDPDPDARIIGWVSRDSRFTITGNGTSPSGALWYSIEMRNGKAGWVYSRWVTSLDD